MIKMKKCQWHVLGGSEIGICIWEVSKSKGDTSEAAASLCKTGLFLSLHLHGPFSGNKDNSAPVLGQESVTGGCGIQHTCQETLESLCVGNRPTDLGRAHPVVALDQPQARWDPTSGVDFTLGPPTPGLTVWCGYMWCCIRKNSRP